MSVKIRLRRVGRKRQPSYRIVVAQVETPRGGEYLDTVGFYNPRSNPAELRLDLEKVDRWLGQGAEMSDTAASLIRKARRGGDAKVALKPMGDQPKAEVEVVGGEAPKKRGRKGAPAAAAAPAAVAAPSEAPAAEAPAAE